MTGVTQMLPSWHVLKLHGLAAAAPKHRRQKPQGLTEGVDQILGAPPVIVGTLHCAVNVRLAEHR